MRVLDWNEFTGMRRVPPEQTAMTIGVFDGVHRGHQRLIAKIVEQGSNPTAVTFRESPKRVISPGTAGGAILSLSQKLEIFAGLGISQTILIDFSENFSKLRGQEFMELLITRGNLTYLVIGSNFRCGYQLDTDAGLIKGCNEERGIKTEVVPPVLAGACPVSSSRIRKAILAGDIAGAQAALGRNVAADLRGIVPEHTEGGSYFDLASQGRVVPPDGQYPAAVIEGEKIAVTVKNGKIFVPSPFNAAWGIEFLSGSQGE